MTDIVERLRAYASDDHERGCKGREYDCSCGYDDKRDPLLEDAAARIERLEAALRAILNVPANWGSEIYDIEEIARAALEERT